MVPPDVWLQCLEAVGRLTPHQRSKALREFALWKNTYGDNFLAFAEQKGWIQPSERHYFHTLLQKGYFCCRACRMIQLLGAKLPSQVACSQCQKKENISIYLPPLQRQVSHWSIIGLLGQGGHGTVWRILDHHSGRTMALKVLHRPNSMLLQRFQREILITARLEHPSIVPVYESGHLEDGTPYFVMKEVKGVHLRQWYRTHRSDSDFFSQSVRHLIRVCEALEFAHSRGVIHRDLKPSNIAISDYAEVLVMDWGIATAEGVAEVVTNNSEATFENNTPDRDSQDLTQTGSMLGTPGYMPPEQLRGEKVDERSDVYAFGATLYEVLTSRPPFTGSTKEKMVKTLSTRPEPPSQIDPSIPEELSAIAMKCLEPKRENRYSSMGQVRQDLQWWLEGRSVSAKEDMPWEKAQKFIRRNAQWLLALSAGIVVVLVFWLGWEWHRHSQKVQQLAQLWQESDRLWKAEVLSLSSDFPKVYAKSRSGLGEASPLLERQRQKAMETCLEVQRLLEDGLLLSPKQKKLRQRLYAVCQKLGELALLNGDYLLAKGAFERCARLFPDRGGLLLEQLEHYRKREGKKILEKLEETLTRLEKAPAKGELEELANVVSRWRSRKVILKLLETLLSSRSSPWQRYLAIEALGRMGETSLQYRGKSVEDWLISLLRQAIRGNPPEWNQEEVVRLIWALGRLRSQKAEEIVTSIRYSVGSLSLLWRQTELPYRWMIEIVPLDTDNSNSAVSQEERNGQLLEIADKAYRKGKLQTAIQLLTQVIQTSSNKAHLHYAYHTRGQSYFNLKKYPEALEDFTNSIQLGPNAIENYLIRALVYRRLKRLSEALQDLNQCLRLDPKESRAYFNRGLIYQDLLNFSQAIADFSQAIQLNPQMVNAYINRGVLYAQQQQYEKALQDFSKAIELDPNSPKAYINRAFIYLQLGNPQRALENASMAIQIHPKRGLPYHNRARIYTELKQYDKALRDLRQAIQLEPRNAKFYLSRGKLYSYLKQYRKALQNFSKAVQLEPNNFQARYQKALTHYLLKDSSKALQELGQILQQNPRYALAFSLRGLILFQQGSPHKAITDFNRSLQLNPHFWQGYLWRGQAYLQLRQYDRARRDLQLYLKKTTLPPEERQYVRQLLQQIPK